MIFYIRRAGILLVLCVLIVSFLIINLGNSMPTDKKVKYTVVIDAGHGAPDGGAVGINTKIQEKDITLAISNLIKEELISKGIHVIMTRTSDSGIHTNTNDSIRNKKRSDLNNRIKIANESKAHAFISIHLNHYSQSDCSGPQIFYAANVNGSDKLADYVRDGFLNIIGDHCTRETKPIKNELFLLRETKIPSVIAECGFLSNPNEEKLLSTPEYQKKIAHAIVLGIEKYLV